MKILVPRHLRSPRGVWLACAAAAALVASAANLHAQTWNIQWSDEFNAASGAAPDSGNWVYDTGGGGWGNAELEFYCAPYSTVSPCIAGQSNLYQDGSGNLVIHAVKTNGTWTSGRMNTSGKHSFQYGRVEARMKLQPGDGFWPAFWMLGSAIGGVGWPIAGEQDIMEWVQSYGPGATSSTLHGPGYSGANSIGAKFSFPNGERIDDGNYHTYGVVWSPNLLQLYRDNPTQPFFTMTPASIPSGRQWVYNHPFFILLNLAIGSGGFPGKTDASTPSSSTALVDYVLVYQTSTAINPAKWYTVASKNSGACLDDANGNTGNGAALDQTLCGGSLNRQQWQFTPTDSGFYKVSSRNAPFAWEVKGGAGATTIQVPVELSTYGGGSNQQWKPVSLGNGTFQFVARNSGICLDIPGASTANGVQLQQYTCNGTNAQAFILTQQP